MTPLSVTCFSRRSLIRHCLALCSIALCSIQQDAIKTVSPHSSVDPKHVGMCYRATVDRIVDETHVVLLVELEQETIAQYAVPRSELPTVQEGDRVFVVGKSDSLVLIRINPQIRTIFD
ncbi:hypothetical protein HUB97_04575 [Halorubraceae archaeon YAN]|nr:hypothetical protein [Halorubraceae archaeon YAN]